MSCPSPEEGIRNHTSLSPDLLVFVVANFLTEPFRFTFQLLILNLGAMAFSLS